MNIIKFVDFLIFHRMQALKFAGLSFFPDISQSQFKIISIIKHKMAILAIFRPFFQSRVWNKIYRSSDSAYNFTFKIFRFCLISQISANNRAKNGKKHVLAILTILGPFFRNDHQIQNYRSSNSTEGRCFQIFKIPHSFWVISKKLKKRWVDICLGHVLPIQGIFTKM